MHTIFGYFALLASVVGALIFTAMFYNYYAGGFDNGRGMAMLVFQAFGSIAIAIGLLVGVGSRLLAKAGDHLPSKASLASIAIALVTGTIFLLSLFLS